MRNLHYRSQPTFFFFLQRLLVRNPLPRVNSTPVRGNINEEEEENEGKGRGEGEEDDDDEEVEGWEEVGGGRRVRRKREM